MKSQFSKGVELPKEGQLGLAGERKLRRDAEQQLRDIESKHKRLELELDRYREHFESLVSNRTVELMAINEKLVKENRDRRLAQRERRAFEDQLREASLLLETMLNAIPDIIGVQDTQLRIIRFNDAGYRFFGKSEQEVIGQHCYEMIDQQGPCEQCIAEKILKTGKPASFEKYLENRGVWMDIRAYPILDMDGRVIRIVEHWRDITVLKKSQASLEESEQKYRLLVENAKEAIFIFQGGKYRFSNRLARQMASRIGLTKDGRSFVDHLHPDEPSDRAENIIKQLEGRKLESRATLFRLGNGRNETMWVELNTVKLTWKGKPATLNFARDITRDKELEQRFQEAQRMESIGTLAGGIAHDFNNLLMGIQGNVSLMYLDVDHNHPLEEKLQSIEECVASGSRLTKQLLGFARGGKYVVKPVDLNKILQSSADMFGRTRKLIKMDGDFEKNLWTVIADGNQLEQVLVNLYLNAWQAMQGAGDVYLKSRNVMLSPSFVKPYDVQPGPYVKISVRDTGIGMNESTKKRIFEPFFTTHAPGRGTGLGLASAFGIIKNHSGIIRVESKLGRGSTFYIYLPASDEKPEVETARSESITSGEETILMVDDEAYILDVGQLMLQGLGYSVITAENGPSAVEIYAQQNDHIDLVILDLLMPDMGGEIVYEKIKQIRPDVKVLFASGHYVGEQAQSLVQSEKCDFLQKPFNIRQLSTRIRQILDS
jgi:PAS domain S-box-containing protein